MKEDEEEESALNGKNAKGKGGGGLQARLELLLKFLFKSL
jgi:hypothetical protein